MIKSGPTFGDDREITPEFEQQVRDYYRVETTRTQVRGAYGAYYAPDAMGGKKVTYAQANASRHESAPAKNGPL